jgi:hypothetical protein
MSNDSFKTSEYYCLYICRYCTVFSGKLAMATCHANICYDIMIINLQCKSLNCLKTCIAWPVAMASFPLREEVIVEGILYKIAHAKKIEL